MRSDGSNDEWRTIHNPLTGEVLTFLEIGRGRMVGELTLPPGGKPVPPHAHPGSESFEVLEGGLYMPPLPLWAFKTLVATVGRWAGKEQKVLAHYWPGGTESPRHDAWRFVVARQQAGTRAEDDAQPYD